ncbi:MAG TPA: phosphoesterase [Blastocatellia bacterium]|nr:phosphoesterase [Blastocatellia bacterium]
MKLTVLHHDHCFDGFASAAVFSRAFLDKIEPNAEVVYTGLAHKPNQKFIEEELFDGDQNAIVDFKYSPSPLLTWWFDHHQSAFLSPEDEKHYWSGNWATKFYDPHYKSCTQFIADTMRDKYGFRDPHLDELVRWADIIDGAQYKDARTAVELEAPALRLMLVIEASRDRALMEKIIREMQTRALADIIADPQVDGVFRPLFDRHEKMIELIREAAHVKSGVVYFDLSGHEAEGYSKFIPYYLFPESVYSVGVSLSPGRSKVSVGFNPWSPQPRRHNLASICERYNGGGHAVVGAISLRPDQIETAREVAQAIARELRGEA